jgi:hypothetical protein
MTLQKIELEAIFKTVRGKKGGSETDAAQYYQGIFGRGYDEAKQGLLLFRYAQMRDATDVVYRFSEESFKHDLCEPMGVEYLPPPLGQNRPIGVKSIRGDNLRRSARTYMESFETHAMTRYGLALEFAQLLIRAQGWAITKHSFDHVQADAERLSWEVYRSHQGRCRACDQIDPQIADLASVK